MTKKHVGIIAEDESDVEVLKELGRKISGRNFSASHHIGKGCGQIKAKTSGWCASLKHKGCKSLILVHDRDDKDALKLRAELESVLEATKIDRRYIAIPSEELEAWLLSDCVAIKDALNLETEPKSIANPESINSPKERLGDLVRMHSKGRAKVYVNTEHNRLIAQKISVTEIDKKCPSFGDFKGFVESEIGSKPVTNKSKK